mmetsp:Transcript_93619/g.136746  ORF Transcript_93619/g.136746 Transcript_93619/m.136746 type:complete len:238 (-) Transcript_93619:317-1030(-)
MIRAVPVATASFCVLAVLVLVNLNSAACLQQRAVEQELAGAAAASSGPWAILARHGEKDEDNVSDIDLNQRGRIRASAMGALLYPAPGTSRKLYTAPLPACLQNSIPIALAAQVPDVHKSVRRCKETAEIIQAQADISGATGITLAPFGIMDGDALAAWVWKQSLSKNGQMDSISVTIWDHSDAHELVNKILNTTDTPKWPGDRYDVWWLLDLSSRQMWEYSHGLLMGDKKDPPRLV